MGWQISNYQNQVGFMNGILNACTMILCILWLIGFFVFHAGMLIHLLLVIALISVILNVVESKQLAD